VAVSAPATLREPPGAAAAVEVVRAGPDDVPRVAPLFDAYRGFYGQPPDPRGAGAFLSQRLDRGESVVFLALDGGRAVGFTQLYPSFSSVAMRRLWILNDLYVAEDARRRGVAAALMSRAERFAADDGARGLMLETARDNPARFLYHAMGWKLDDEHLYFTRDL
jgi:GNAT superfamily N-acetyltransferase